VLVFDCSKNSGVETVENVLNNLLSQDEQTSVRKGRDDTGSWYQLPKASNKHWEKV
jgi:hypothetical protein